MTVGQQASPVREHELKTAGQQPAAGFVDTTKQQIAKAGDAVSDAANKTVAAAKDGRLQEKAQEIAAATYDAASNAANKTVAAAQDGRLQEKAQEIAAATYDAASNAANKALEAAKDAHLPEKAQEAAVATYNAATNVVNQTVEAAKEGRLKEKAQEFASALYDAAADAVNRAAELVRLKAPEEVQEAAGEAKFAAKKKLSGAKAAGRDIAEDAKAKAAGAKQQVRRAVGRPDDLWLRRVLRFSGIVFGLFLIFSIMSTMRSWARSWIWGSHKEIIASPAAPTVERNPLAGHEYAGGSTLDKFSSKASGIVDDAKDAAASTLERAKDLAGSSIPRDLTGAGQRAFDIAKERLDGVADLAQDQFEQVKGRVEGAAKGVSESGIGAQERVQEAAATAADKVEDVWERTRPQHPHQEL